MLEGHPVHTTGPQHQHAVLECAGKVAKTNAHYSQTISCMANRQNLLLCFVTETEALHWCMAPYHILDRTVAKLQMRKRLDTYANLVHGFSMPGLKTRHDNIDIVVIR